MSTVVRMKKKTLNSWGESKPSSGSALGYTIILNIVILYECRRSSVSPSMRMFCCRRVDAAEHPNVGPAGAAIGSLIFRTVAELLSALVVVELQLHAEGVLACSPQLGSASATKRPQCGFCNLRTGSRKSCDF